MNKNIAHKMNSAHKTGFLKWVLKQIKITTLDRGQKQKNLSIASSADRTRLLKRNI